MEPVAAAETFPGGGNKQLSSEDATRSVGHPLRTVSTERSCGGAEADAVGGASASKMKAVLLVLGALASFRGGSGGSDSPGSAGSSRSSGSGAPHILFMVV